MKIGSLIGVSKIFKRDEYATSRGSLNLASPHLCAKPLTNPAFFTAVFDPQETLQTIYDAETFLKAPLWQKDFKPVS